MFYLPPRSIVVRRGGRSRRPYTCASGPGSWLRVRTLLPERGLSGVRHFDPSLVRRGAFDVAVVPVPPLVGRGLRIALGRILPLLLAAERRDIEVVPGASHLLVAAVVDEVGSVNLVAVAEEHVGAVPFADAKVGVKTVRDGVPGYHLPSHSRLLARDVRLRRARGEHERGVTRVQM